MNTNRVLLALTLALTVGACAPVSTYTDAEAPKALKLDSATTRLDVRFIPGTAVLVSVDAARLRQLHPQVPIIILSATLERRFGGVEDMHLLKGYSSIDDLVTALRSFEAKRRGKPVVVDARDFFYSRINMAMGDDVVLEILDGEGTWQYVNETCARVL